MCSNFLCQCISPLEYIWMSFQVITFRISFIPSVKEAYLTWILLVSKFPCHGFCPQKGAECFLISQNYYIVFSFSSRSVVSMLILMLQGLILSFQNKLNVFAELLDAQNKKCNSIVLLNYHGISWFWLLLSSPVFYFIFYFRLLNLGEKMDQ